MRKAWEAEADESSIERRERERERESVFTREMKADPFVKNSNGKNCIHLACAQVEREKE